MTNRLNMSAAMDTVEQEPPAAEAERKRYVNLRLKAVEYKKIGHIATDAGITNTAFCKMAALFMADLINTGVYTVNGGGFVPVRRGYKEVVSE